MLKAKNIFAPLLGVLYLALSGCSTDVDVNAPYQEVPIVYALLNADSSYFNIRVNKGFQNTNGDARDIALNNPDSSNYPIGSLKVELLQVQVNGTEQSYEAAGETLFQPVTIQKDNSYGGEFYTGAQVVYRNTRPLKLEIKRGTALINYKVKVTNLASGKVVFATTTLVDSAVFVRPDPVTGNFRALNFTGNTADNPVIFQSAPLGAGIGKVNLVLSLRETYTDNSFKDTTIVLENVTSYDYQRGRSNDIENATFRALLVSKLHKKPNLVKRQFFTYTNANAGRLMVYLATGQLRDYIDVLKSYSAITQTVGTYTNVTGGLGLVAGCNTATLTVGISNSTINNFNALGSNGAPLYPEVKDLKFDYSI